MFLLRGMTAQALLIITIINMFARLAAASSALLLQCAIATTLLATQSVTVTWDANIEPDVVGYRFFYGTQSGVYSNQVDVVAPIAVASALLEGETYYFAAIAYNINGIESEFSDEISYTVPGSPPSPSPTPSGTPTPTATATATPSAPPSATPTATATATATPTATPHGTPTATATATPTATATATATPIAPPSATPTATPAVTPETGGLVNVSTRALVASDQNVLIGGFIITGDIPRTVVLRGIGPSLRRSGVENAAADPVLTLFDSTGTALAVSDDWDAQDPAMIASGLAPTEALESMLIATLPAGAYTAVLESKDSPGVALFELYQLGNNMASGVVNLATRGHVGVADDVMIAGFILAGDQATRVIVRAIGPSLSQAGISQPLADPELELHDGNGSLIFQNDNWRSDQEAQIVASGMAPSAEQESAIIATLPAGNYSAVARGVGGTEGVAVVEIYALD
jgi:hypothetical protein